MKKLTLLATIILIPVMLMAGGHDIPTHKEAPLEEMGVALLNLQHENVNLRGELDSLQARINGLRLEATSLSSRYNKLWVENARLKAREIEIVEKVILKEIEKETTPWWVWPVVVVALII